jgi:hypothetical protein
MVPFTFNPLSGLCHVLDRVPEKGAIRGATSLVKAFGPEAIRHGAVVCRTEGAYPLAEKGRLIAIPLGGSGGLHAFLNRNS